LKTHFVLSVALHIWSDAGGEEEEESAFWDIEVRTVTLLDGTGKGAPMPLQLLYAGRVPEMLSEKQPSRQSGNLVAAIRTGTSKKRRSAALNTSAACVHNMRPDSR